MIRPILPQMDAIQGLRCQLRRPPKVVTVLNHRMHCCHQSNLEESGKDWRLVPKPPLKEHNWSSALATTTIITQIITTFCPIWVLNKINDRFKSKIFLILFFQQEHHFLLQRVLPSDANRKCLIVDLDETLVHSSFKVILQIKFK
jgi:hypothetical protein